MTKKLLTVLAFATLLFSACTNKDASQYQLMIPDDAAFVAHINGSSLSSKISWAEISQTSWFQKIVAESHDSTAATLLKDPASSGIDTKSDLVVFSRNQSQRSYVIVAGTIANAESFEKFIRSMHKDSKSATQEEKGFSYIASGDGTVVWNKSRFAVAANNSSGIGGGGPMNSYPDDSESAGSKGFAADSLKLFAITALTPKSSKNLEADSRYQEMIKDGRDFHLWVNSGSLGSGLSRISPIDMSSWMEGNVSAMSFNFDNGKITGRFKQYPGPQLKKLYEKHSAEPISAALVNRVADTNSLAVMVASFPPAAIKDFLKATSADTFLEMGLGQQGFSIDDLINATKGQLLLSASSSGTSTEPANPMSTVKFLFATSVNDKKAFEKLVTSIWDTFKKVKGAGEEGGKAPELPFSYKIQDDWFALSNVPEMTDAFLAGKSGNAPFASRVAGHRFGLYVDLQKIMKIFHRGDDAEAGGVSMSVAEHTWEDILFTGGEFVGGASTGEMEINLVDKTTNSLKQLNIYMDKMVKAQQQRRAAWMQPDAPETEAPAESK